MSLRLAVGSAVALSGAAVLLGKRFFGTARAEGAREGDDGDEEGSSSEPQPAAQPVPGIFYHDTNETVREILSLCPRIRAGYHPPSRLLNGGHASTIFGAVIRSSVEGTVPYIREGVPVERAVPAPHGADADAEQPLVPEEIHVDWLGPDPSTVPNDSTDPILIILPGLTSSSHTNYVSKLALAAAAAGYRVAVVNNRGCAGEPIRTPFITTAAYTEDVRRVVVHLRDRNPLAPLFAVGISLGSIILTKYLGEEGMNSKLLAAMLISNPWDLDRANDKLERFPQSVLYGGPLCRGLRQLVARNRLVFERDGRVDLARVAAARTIREFDSAFVVPLHGYANVEAYYADATSVRHHQYIQIPTLYLSAIDDPFCDAATIPVRATGTANPNPNLVFALSETGGHVAFPVCRDHSFMETALVEFFGAARQVLLSGADQQI